MKGSRLPTRDMPCQEPLPLQMRGWSATFHGLKKQRSEWHGEVVDAGGPTCHWKVTFAPSQEEPLEATPPTTSLWAPELHSPSAPACLHTVGGQETPAEFNSKYPVFP